MRGSPLLRAIFAFLVILSLGYPLWRMTSSGDAPQAAVPRSQADTAQDVHLQLTFTLTPRSVKVLHLGREIWTDQAPTADIEKDLKIPYPNEGVDLQFQIAWPAAAPLAAVRVKLTDPAGDVHEKSIWSNGPADEVLTFP